MFLHNDDVLKTITVISWKNKGRPDSIVFATPFPVFGFLVVLFDTACSVAEVQINLLSGFTLYCGLVTTVATISYLSVEDDKLCFHQSPAETAFGFTQIRTAPSFRKAGETNSPSAVPGTVNKSCSTNCAFQPS